MKIIFFTFLLTFSVVYSDKLPCKCNLDKTLFNSNNQIAKVNSIPWIASVANYADDHFCNAAIINEKFLLAADHCFKRRAGQTMYVQVGLYDRMKKNEDRVHSIKTIIRSCTEFGPLLGDFDLIELRTPIKFVPGEVEPACLNLVDRVFKDNLIVAGWGFLEKPKKDFDFDYPKYRSSLLNYYLSTEINNNCKENDICVEAKNKKNSICNDERSAILMETINGKTGVIGLGSSSNFQTTKENHCTGQTSFSRLQIQKEFIEDRVGDFCDFY